MKSFTFLLDGQTVSAEQGQSIMQSADRAGIYIPRLCSHPELTPFGACRVCTVLVNGRAQAACTHPASPGLVVENETERLLDLRRSIIDMLFVEGNHYCMFCERSGTCELQAMAYRFGIKAPRFPFRYPKRDLDASHPEAFIDHNRCILCARCIRASIQIDGKHVLDFAGRGPGKRVSAGSARGLGGSRLAADDRAIAVCPVGALMRKHVGYATPIGNRTFDEAPIGTTVETRRVVPPQE